MDTHKYTTMLYNFLKDNGLTRIILGGNHVSGTGDLMRCYTLVCNAVGPIRSKTSVQHTLWYDIPSEIPSVKRTTLPPEELFTHILNDATVIDRIRGVCINFMYFDDIWRAKVLSDCAVKEPPPTKQNYKSIW